MSFAREVVGALLVAEFFDFAAMGRLMRARRLRGWAPGAEGCAALA